MAHEEPRFGAADSLLVLGLAVASRMQLVEELLEAGRLLDVVEGAGLEPLDRGVDGAVAGEQDHLDHRVGGLDGLEHRDAVHARHPDVEDHHVALGLVEGGQAGIAVVGRADPVAGVLEA